MERRRLYAVALTCCVAVSSWAQDTTDVFSRHLHLKEVVVTGLTGDSKLSETPAAVSVLDAHTIRSNAAGNIIDAIAREPGVSQISTGGGISKPVIRGLGYNRVVVIADGLRQEGQQWGDEHGVELDGNSVHSAEIIKGPASLSWATRAVSSGTSVSVISMPMPTAMRRTVWFPAPSSGKGPSPGRWASTGNGVSPA